MWNSLQQGGACAPPCRNRGCRPAGLRRRRGGRRRPAAQHAATRRRPPISSYSWTGLYRRRQPRLPVGPHEPDGSGREPLRAAWSASTIGYNWQIGPLGPRVSKATSTGPTSTARSPATPVATGCETLEHLARHAARPRRLRVRSRACPTSRGGARGRRHQGQAQPGSAERARHQRRLDRRRAASKSRSPATGPPSSNTCYVDLGDMTCGAGLVPCRATSISQSNVLRAGVNYRF